MLFGPTDKEFFYTVTDKIDGWLHNYTARLTINLLRFQEPENTGKPLVEIGVFSGRYFSLLMASAGRSNSQAIGIDPWQFKAPDIVFDHLKTLMPDLFGITKFFSEMSIAFTPERLIEVAGGRPRFVSIDGSHECDDVMYDLRLCDGALDDDEIIAVDDFFNPVAMGVDRAVNAFMESGPNIEGIAYCANKLFLGRPATAGKYRKFIEDVMMGEDTPEAGVFRERLVAYRGMVEQMFFGHPIMIVGP